MIKTNINNKNAPDMALLIEKAIKELPMKVLVITDICNTILRTRHFTNQ